MMPPHPRSTLFPYTTLFRSLAQIPFQPEALRDVSRGGVQAFECHALLMQVLDALPLGFACPPGRVRHRGEGGHEARSEEHTSELQSRRDLVCRLLLEKKKNR